MTDIFGIPIQTISTTLSAGFLIAISIVVIMGLKNRIILKLALRNIPRRPGQTVLIIIGIMLSTVIISASLGTGDTLTYSIKNSAIKGLGDIDEIITKKMILIPDDWSFSPQYIPYSEYENLTKEFKQYENIDGVAALIIETIAVNNARTSLTDGRVNFTAFETSKFFGTSFGALQSTTNNTLNPEDLNENQIIINVPLSEKIDAQVGDELQLFLGEKTEHVRVKGIVEASGTAGVEPTIIVSIGYAQSLLEIGNQINSIMISNKGDAYQGADLSKEVTKKLRVHLADKSVALELKNLLSKETVIQAISSHSTNLSETQKTKIDQLIQNLSNETITDDLVDLLSQDMIRNRIIAALNKEGVAKSEIGEIETLFDKLSDFTISDLKTQLLEFADLTGNFITSFFMIFGSFSMMVGILLIFLIFVLLAAARRSEMGMMRAIGARRGHLIQMFIFEGTAYSLISAAIGVALGLGVSALMVITLNNIFSTFTDFFELKPSFTINGIIISYCLGMVITFVTVTVSAYRVSYLNIVTAVRGLPAPINEKSSSFRDIIISPIRDFKKPVLLSKHIVSYLVSLNFIKAGESLFQFFISVILLPQVFLITIIRIVVHFFMQGWFALIIGVAISYLGAETQERASIFGLGISLLIIGIGLVTRKLLQRTNIRHDIRDRIVFTFMGISILSFWILPVPYEKITGELEGGPDILFASGVTMVAAAVWTIMYNSDLIVRLATFLTGRSGKIRPILVTAVAYPMSAKFRTGITLAMFALVVFTLTVMSVLSSTFGTQFSDPEVVTGGWDIESSINFKTPIKNIRKEMDEISIQKIQAIGGYIILGAEARTLEGNNPEWENTALWAVDEGFTSNAGYGFKLFAQEYGPSDEDVWQALKDNPNLAVVGGNSVPTSKTRNDIWRDNYIDNLYYESDEMTPVTIEVKVSNAESIAHLTVIGVLDRVHEYSGTSVAIYTSKTNIDAVMASDLPITNYRFKTDAGSDIKEISRSIEKSFIREGMETTDIQKALNEEDAAGKTFTRLFIAFMSLGLFVGVAALGVVSTRAVVERRQQIGVLRAIGYKRYMVQMSFLLESSFISVMGVLIGLVLGLTLSYNAFLDIRDDASIDNLLFSIPWLQLGTIISITYVFAIITTYIPSRQASRISPAEALRYE